MGVGRYQTLSKWAWAVIKRYQPLSTGLITFDNDFSPNGFDNALTVFCIVPFCPKSRLTRIPRGPRPKTKMTQEKYLSQAPGPALAQPLALAPSLTPPAPPPAGLTD